MWLVRTGLAGLIVFAAVGADAREVDPWEPMNRKIYAFNDFTDRWVLKPIARGYDTITPKPVQRGIRNFFYNLTTPAVGLLQFLQGKPSSGASDFGRFLVNTTLGVGGVFDPAGRMGLVRHEEDVGQTLGVWGVQQGPYLVIPLRGPSTVRDATGLFLDTFLHPLRYVDDVPVRNSLFALSSIDLRAELLSTESLLSGDRYLFIRDAFLQRREFLVNDGQILEDPFLDDFDDE